LDHLFENLNGIEQFSFFSRVTFSKFLYVVSTVLWHPVVGKLLYSSSTRWAMIV